MTANEIEIEYCVPCGYLPAAEETAHALLSAYGQRLGGLRLKPGHGGVFRVSVDGTRVFDNGEEGYDVEAIVGRVEGRLAPEPSLRS
ncbi:MAG TPA: Rdx family protein [Actinomycetota bacterium]|nr:Rdx family protein [Actinomycetota bacterium]